MQAQTSVAELADLTLEQLVNVEITSVSRRSEPLSQAAGSVYVISAEDIRRSGAVSLPEALRLAPNLHVARVDGTQYAISTRGFNSTTANKMLVMIDGRTVYSVLFSGVFWDAQDVMLEDVERIEVMSGSGGTLWGSNAVNGFINIITRRAADTQGLLASLGAGNRDRVGAARYGGETSNGGHWRVYGKRSERDGTSTAAGASRNDSSERTQAGFRTDWGNARDDFTVQGDIYDADISQAAPNGPRRLGGLNVLGRWTRDEGAGGNWRLQAYYDRTERRQPGSIDDSLDTFDVEAQHGWRAGTAHNLLAGAGYRWQDDRARTISPSIAFLPEQRKLRLANVFLQDAVALMPRVELTLGLKLEHNDYTGLEYLPNARIAWKPSEAHLFWGAASRAVRIPSRIDREVVSPATPPYTGLAGGPNFDSEIARVYEVGYRGQPMPALSYSATLFHHRFDRQRSLEPAAAGPTIENLIDGSLNGIEAWGSWRVNPGWRLNAGFVRQKLNLHPMPGSNAINGTATLGNDPNHWWSLGSSFDLGSRWQFDVAVRRVGALPSPAVPAYTAVDARLGWRVRPDLELSLTAQNLGDPAHTEWGSAPARAEIGRSLFLKAVWKL